jgi:hypothetical protein
MIYSKKWVAIGTKIEMEHTQNRAIAHKIALDHFKEFGNAYYPALIKMEHQLSMRKKK